MDEKEVGGSAALGHGPAHGLCIGLIVVALGGLVIYVLLTGGARKEFDELAQRVEKETVGLPAGQTPKAYADLKAENPDFVGWIKIEAHR